MKVVKRDGNAVDFDRSKIRDAIFNCILDVEGVKSGKVQMDPDGNSRMREIAERTTDAVVASIQRRARETVHIEEIQDQVELALMRGEFHRYARAYVLYREQQAQKRQAERQGSTQHQPLTMIDHAGKRAQVDMARYRRLLERNAAGLSVDLDQVFSRFEKNLFNEMTQQQVDEAFMLAASSMIEQDPDYAVFAGALLEEQIWEESLRTLGRPEIVELSDYLDAYLAFGIEKGLLDPRLERFNVRTILDHVDFGQDNAARTYLGVQTLYDRYLLHWEEQRFETVTALFLRVAMGLALYEEDLDAKAAEFFRVMLCGDYMPSTPTLFNAGTLRPQLSSCYLTTVPDDLDGIYSAIKDNALLSKFAGGLGNDWTPVRGMGAHIKGTNGKSQGVIPFLKVANDTAVAVNQGGRRKGAVCAYLETWHIDIDDFLDLRKNTGEERRRTHDMNTANWIPDLFMKRVAEDGDWTLFSPDEVPDLHDLTGQAFEDAYLRYEEMAGRGEIKVHRKVRANELWRKMLGVLFETGHPWIAFKDPCNIRYTNQHRGAVHSSNLCTEITLHTNDNEIAVCNLGSINLAAHVVDGKLDTEKLERTVNIAMRMLDNVIDINYYSVEKARHSNVLHRPVGLGIMGFQDALYKLRLPYASMEAVEFADRSMEAVSYFAIQASTDLAEERGRYHSFEGSLWSRGILPIDSLALLGEQRGKYLQVDTTARLDWDRLRERVKTVGMRNSNTMAIAPTATISNICGVSQSIEPTYQHLFVKSNLSGEFTVVNPYLVRDLKERGLWDEVMINDLKYYDGSVQPIDRIPEDLKQLYASAFEIDPRWLVEAGSRRQKWIDQAQSLNLYMAEPSGKKLDNLYKLAWVRGLKTTYYLRSMGATHVEKVSDGPRDLPTLGEKPKACSILDPDCEACQ